MRVCTCTCVIHCSCHDVTSFVIESTVCLFHRELKALLVPSYASSVFFFVSFPLSVVISLLAINFVVSINAHTRGSLCSPRAQRRFTREAIHASMDKRDAIRQVRGAPVFVIPCKLNITWKEKERKKEWNKEKSISRDSAIN